MFSTLLHPGGGRKSSAQRPTTPSHLANSGPSPKEVKEKPKPSPVPSIEKDARDPTVLRKRTTSAPAVSSPQKSSHTNGSGAGMSVTEGQSILDQIGEPDHCGWMRKKGERYNAWKMRYFVLKGDHMYWLRSSYKSVRKSFVFLISDIY
jgi:hypothetical protein